MCKDGRTEAKVTTVNACYASQNLKLHAVCEVTGKNVTRFAKRVLYAQLQIFSRFEILHIAYLKNA